MSAHPSNDSAFELKQAAIGLRRTGRQRDAQFGMGHRPAGRIDHLPDEGSKRVEHQGTEIVMLAWLAVHRGRLQSAMSRGGHLQLVIVARPERFGFKAAVGKHRHRLIGHRGMRSIHVRLLAAMRTVNNNLGARHGTPLPIDDLAA